MMDKTVDKISFQTANMLEEFFPRIKLWDSHLTSNMLGKKVCDICNVNGM